MQININVSPHAIFLLLKMFFGQLYFNIGNELFFNFQYLISNYSHPIGKWLQKFLDYIDVDVVKSSWPQGAFLINCMNS
jgi:hypothetical protein